MNGYQFSELWELLCRNYGKDIGKMKKTEEDFFRSFKYIHVDVFDRAVNTLVNDVDRVERFKEYEKFPTLGELRKYIKRIQKAASETKYPDCKACENSPSGLVSMILGYKIIDGEDKIVERHHWSVAKKIKLRKEDNGIRYYDFSFACRCERGFALCNARGGNPPPITPEEFEELKAYNTNGGL